MGQVEASLHSEMQQWTRQQLMGITQHVEHIEANIATCKAGTVGGYHFKRSVDKDSDSCGFLPTNLHTQHTFFPGLEKAMYSNVTVGAFSAHIYNFHRGEGVAQIRKKCKKLWDEVRSSAGKKMSGGRTEGYTTIP